MNEIAFIIDGEVVDILRADDRLAAILLSEPTIVDVTKINALGPVAMTGHTYDAATGKFSHPQGE
jgi:hypothetical protein